MNSEPETSKKFSVRLRMFFNAIKTKILSLVLKDPLLKGIVIIGSGSAVAQILGIIFVPILTRIYPPAIYGTLAVFGSLLSILIVGASFKYELTIPLPENDSDAEYLFILSFLIVCSLTIILLLVLAIWGDTLAGIFHFEFITPYYWLFGIGFFGIALYQILTYWALRSKDYVTMTQTRITQSISGSVSKIIFGLLSLGSLGLICGDIIGNIVGIGTLGRTIFRRIWHTFHVLDVHKLKSLAQRYKKFPTYSLPAGLINEIALSAPTLMISYMFGYEVVGLFALSFSMVIKPVSLITSSLAQVYFGEIAELFRQRSDRILSFYQDTTKKLFMFGAPLIFIGAVLSPVLFPILFGSEWKEAGIFAIPLSFMVIAQFVVSSTDRLELYGYNHWELYWNICRTLMVIGGFYLAFLLSFSPVATILLYSILMTIMYAVCYYLNITAIKQILQKKGDPVPD